MRFENYLKEEKLNEVFEILVSPETYYTFWAITGAIAGADIAIYGKPIYDKIKEFFLNRKYKKAKEWLEKQPSYRDLEDKMENLKRLQRVDKRMSKENKLELLKSIKLTDNERMRYKRQLKFALDKSNLDDSQKRKIYDLIPGLSGTKGAE